MSSVAAAASNSLGLARLGPLELRHAQVKVRRLHRLELGIGLDDRLETLLGAIRVAWVGLAELEVADAQVMEGAVQAGIGRIGLDELDPFFGGQVVDAAVLQATAAAYCRVAASCSSASAAAGRQQSQPAAQTAAAQQTRS